MLFLWNVSRPSARSVARVIACSSSATVKGWSGTVACRSNFTPGIFAWEVPTASEVSIHNVSYGGMDSRFLTSVSSSEFSRMRAAGGPAEVPTRLSGSAASWGPGVLTSLLALLIWLM